MVEFITNEMDTEEYEEMYWVVKNAEEQYSIWPSYRKIPDGWETVGKAQSKAACLSYIDQNWTDMRPLSLRLQMQRLG